MNTSNKDFWDELMVQLQPILEMGEQLLEAVESLCQNYQTNLNLDLDFEDLPVSLQKKLKSVIEKIIDNSTSFSFIESKDLYQAMIEQLNILYQKNNYISYSVRYSLLHLMQEIMQVSIEHKVMELSDWKNYLEQRSEFRKIKDGVEYVFKKVSISSTSSETYSIYDFFYNNHSTEEIDILLNQTKDSLLLIQKHRNITGKRGQGLSRNLINIIHRWQETGIMKPMKSVFPFCQLLRQHWNDEINLGSRQGLEATYKIRI